MNHSTRRPVTWAYQCAWTQACGGTSPSRQSFAASVYAPVVLISRIPLEPTSRSGLASIHGASFRAQVPVFRTRVPVRSRKILASSGSREWP